MILSEHLWSRLAAHLFRADRDERGAVVLAGQAPGPCGPGCWAAS
jgi:hypothetical protein